MKVHVVIATTVLAAALTGCQPGPAATPVVRPTSTASTTPPIDLTVLAFGPDEAPQGMEHDETIVGLDALTAVIVSGRDAEFQALDGFVDGRATLFSGEAGALLTAALHFESARTAADASHAFQDELTRSDGYGFTDTVRNTVALESLCGTGPNPELDDLIESICIWHTGPITFLVGGPVPMSEILAISKNLAERASPWASQDGP